MYKRQVYDNVYYTPGDNILGLELDYPGWYTVRSFNKGMLYVAVNSHKNAPKKRIDEK